MTRIRITLQSTVEYDADPENYPDSDPEKMLQVDIENVKNDPMLMEELGGKWIVTGSVTP